VKLSVLALALLFPFADAATPVKEAGMIAGGIVEGFIGADDIKTCIQGMVIPMGDIEKVVKDFEKKKAKDVMKGLQELADALHALPDALATCKATESDIKQIVHALAQFHSPKSFVFHVGKNLVVNHHEIYIEITTAVSDYKSQKWSDFGVQVGMALHKLIVGSHDKFSEFTNTFGKKYESDSERHHRFGVFLKNLENIKNFRRVEGASASYSHLTPFADLTQEEFSAYNGFKPHLQTGEATPLLEALDTSNLPDNFDWVEQGAVNPVKNQASCGSCWAFATVANIEGAAFVANKKLFSLSEQELVDCDKKNGDMGCHGGLPSNAYNAMIQNNIGLETEHDYPYKAKEQTCKAEASKEKVFIGGWASISTDEDQIAAALMQYGPLSIGINAGTLQFYRGGVAHPWKTLCNPEQLNHGVAIVGFGVDGDEKYWKIRNSWGQGWGENGYFRIIRGTGACGLNAMVTTATKITVKGVKGDGTEIVV